MSHNAMDERRVQTQREHPQTTGEYHKINSLYKRDPSGKVMLFGLFTQPEFEYLKNCEWVFTEKVDGTNIRVIVADGKIRFGGKTDNAQISTKLLTRLQEQFLSDAGKRLLDKIPSGVLYGEGFGPGIQSGGLYRTDQAFVLFDVNVDGWWLLREAVEDVAKSLELEIVPIVGRGTLADLESLVQSEFKSAWGDCKAEGVVARPAVELRTRSGERIITKLKVKDFLTLA